jgi:DNA-binding winged helix-turn-helix (wHTH) protein
VTSQGFRGDIKGRSPLAGHLASNPGALMSKDTMLDLFWPDAHVAENTVDRTIARIRKALDDDAGRPTFIQTISGEGY